MFEIVLYHPTDRSVASVQKGLFSSADRIYVIGKGEGRPLPDRFEAIEGQIGNGRTVAEVAGRAAAELVLFIDGRFELVPDSSDLKRLLDVASDTGAGIVYSNYREGEGNLLRPHPVNDYQTGSIRDDFDFGPLMLFSTAAVKASLQKPGSLPDLEFAGLYDLRLRISEDFAILHLPEGVYAVSRGGRDAEAAEGDKGLFEYVDPANRAVQVEMEKAATAHLKRIGAYLSPEFEEIGEDEKGGYPVEASVIIPVKNRVGTIKEAIASALGQRTDFPFNVIVIDNHSTDGTGEAVAELAGQDNRVIRLVPPRQDLGIGGCWNEAVRSKSCGRYAVQLDSDDLYSSPSSLQEMVDLLRSNRYAMAIGSYQLVNSRLEPIPPGLIDHREWTEDNGRNNALRVNGLGAPRAFVTRLIRAAGFPNVSYGEDYAAALALSRRYRIGRSYDNLYLCRRWEGNTDSSLTLERKNRNDYYKDRIRTLEIAARQKMTDLGRGAKR